MAYYALHDLIFDVTEVGQGLDLTRFLQDFSFFPIHPQCKPPSFSLSISTVPKGGVLPHTARQVFCFENLSGHLVNGDFYLQERSSIFYLPYGKKWAEASLHPDFFHHPSSLRLLGFGLVKLLTTLGYYTLHAAGLLTSTEKGVLISGVSGCGKSTLTIGMIRHGWGYLSDDAVLLRVRREGVKALVFRQPFSIESEMAPAYADLPLGKEPSPSPGKNKRKLNMQEAFPKQHVPESLPEILLFPRIVSRSRSSLKPVSRSHAMVQLLEQSSPGSFNRPTMEEHLQLLTQLVKQCQIYELQAGLDLVNQPEILEDLLAKAEKTT